MSSSGPVITFSTSEAEFLSKGLSKFELYANARLRQRMPAIPKRLGDLSDQIRELKLAVFRPPYVVRENLLPLLRTAILTLRRIEARGRDLKMQETNSAELLAQIEGRIAPFDDLDRKLQQFDTQPLPSLLEFLTLERAEAEISNEAAAPTRDFEKSFRILKEKSAILPDLHYYGTHCDLRGLPVAVAFLDIDRFRDFNTAHGEIVVDRMVLPIFMRSLEAFAFGRGHAYLHGGDECVLILPNADRDLAEGELAGLLRRLGSLEYGVPGRTTVSVGLCVVNPDSALTDREVLELAARAKKFAKENGRNRLAGYDGLLHPKSKPRIMAEGEDVPSPQASAIEAAECTPRRPAS